MKECQRFRQQITKGQFNESIRDVPLSNRRHLESCPECRDWISQLGKIEEQLDGACQIPEVDSEVFRRMKQNIVAAIDATPTRTRFFHSLFLSPKFLTFSSATAILALMIAFRAAPVRHGSDRVSEPIIATTTLLFEELESLDTADPDVLTQALWIHIDTGLMPFIEDEIDASDSTGLSDFMLETARSFQEDDWNALRRYLS